MKDTATNATITATAVMTLSNATDVTGLTSPIAITTILKTNTVKNDVINMFVTLFIIFPL
jgi:hypothetical protein